MTELHEALALRVDTWRGDGYPHDRFPAIGEILGFAIEGESSQSLRYLRSAQLRALETYWYLRLVEGTPHVADLYASVFAGTDRLDAFGLSGEVFLRAALSGGGVDGLIERIKTDDDFAATHRLAALRETLTLGYPSYILALAMGAGKTVLIGAIVATEFAMAIEYPDAEAAGTPFIENAIVFAPGTTILESLRELSTIPFDRLLPPRLHETFSASLKITFTRDGERDIPIVRGSRFNLVVTNTEKIRIQAVARRRARVGGPIAQFFETAEQQARELANLRLQAIASLPHLGVFSDEAHHTYGRSLGTDLKRVRQTVDYLASETNVICVVNTTGTPYFERQPLRDVVAWYGLGQGIRDGTLKEVADNIQTFDFAPEQADEFVSHIVSDFLRDYGDHQLPDGSPARIAIYFPQNDDLDELAPHVELAVTLAGLSPTTILRNTSRSSPAEVDAFNRLNDPEAPHRVILLVNKGTEGWNCPSLFATALARKLKTSQNFVLQAASRCLRQVPGNDRPARIYLSSANRAALDSQLRETYGESLAQLEGRRRESRRAFIRIRKRGLPTIDVRMPERHLTRQASDAGPLSFERPPDIRAGAITRSILEIGVGVASRRVLRQVGDDLTIETSVDTIDVYAAAAHLGANYRLADPWMILDALRTAYGDDSIPVAHLDRLAEQLETHAGTFDETTVEVMRSLAILKPEGFRHAAIDGEDVAQAEISYPVDKADLVFGPERIAENPGDYGFHYEPYNFDSRPEADFLERTLRELNLEPSDVQDLYFTGAITDPKKTDLAFRYQRDNRDHAYTPDFVIHATGDRWMLVEVKMSARRDDPIEGRDGVKARALRDLETRNPDRIVYRIVFADDVVAQPDITAVRDFLVVGKSQEADQRIK